MTFLSPRNFLIGRVRKIIETESDSERGHTEKTNLSGHMFYNIEKGTHRITCSTSTKNEPIGSYVLQHRKTNPSGHMFYNNEKGTQWVTYSTSTKNEPIGSYVLQHQERNPSGHIFYINK